ncbi:MAG: hypothetical protein QM754_05685 [Tepidisphaeraceae bacterium]
MGSFNSGETRPANSGAKAAPDHAERQRDHRPDEANHGNDFREIEIVRRNIRQSRRAGKQ